MKSEQVQVLTGRIFSEDEKVLYAVTIEDDNDYQYWRKSHDGWNHAMGWRGLHATDSSIRIVFDRSDFYFPARQQRLGKNSNLTQMIGKSKEQMIMLQNIISAALDECFPLTLTQDHTSAEPPASDTPDHQQPDSTSE